MRSFLIASIAGVMGFLVFSYACALSRSPHPLQAQAAPLFTAFTLEGDAVHLADHLGKDVVVLDFWATWCPPCRKGLPVLNKMAQDYAGRPVVFYAVNLGEDDAAIRSFVEDTGLGLTVLKDPVMEVGLLYEAEAIPQTVVIGKDGVIADVHVGTFGLNRSVRASINQLLSL